MHFRPYAAYSSTPGLVVTGIAPFAVSPGQPLPGQEWLVVGHEPGYSSLEVCSFRGGGGGGGYSCIYVCMRVFVCTRACVYVCVYVRVCVCIP